ncbi:MAG: hypothetical protein NTY50_02755 [Methylobacter sp.]|nr:hypothetical protein [Methylobacter sp.]
MGQGAETLSATQTDAAGNTSPAGTRAISVDTSVPVAPVINTVATDDIINVAEQTGVITGTNETGATVALSLGGNTRAATVTGTTWSYTLIAADITAMGQGAETLSATQTDAAGNTSPASTRAISVDTSAPTVSSVAISSATGIQNNTLNAGDVVSATVTMSEVTTVTGTPRLALNIGGTTVQANYASGSPGTTLVFTYTILAGQTDANGISIDLNSLTLNSGTIVDAVGNAATLTHTAVTDNAGYKVDTSAPAAPVINTVATDNIINTAEQTSAITGTNETGATVALSLGGNTRAATVTGTTWSYTLVAADITAMGQGAETLSATQTDVAGNTSAAGTRAISVDTSAPIVSSVAISSATGIQNSTLNAGDVVSVTVTMNEATTVTGTPQLALTIGSTPVSANYASGSGSTALVFTYTILAGQTDANGISIAANSLSGTLKDAAGNAATLTHGAVTDNAGYKVDTTAPTASVTTATIVNTGNAVVQSTETGTAYLVNNTVTVTDETSITSSGDTNFNSVSIVTAGTNTNLPATGLVDGTYKVYTVDAAGNLSAPSGNSVTINSSVSCTSQATGSWSASATWVQPQCHNGGVPIAGDNVTIASGHTVTRSITTPPTLATLTINSGGILTNNSALTLTGAMSNAGTYSGNGTVTIGGNFTNTGTYTGGSGTTTLSGNFSNSGTFTAGSGTWTFSGSSALSLTGATSFNNLTLNNAAGLTLNNNVTVSNTLTLTSGILSVGANTLTFNNSIGGVGADTNLSTTSSSNIILSGLGVAIPSSVTTLNNLTINGSATLGSSITLSGTLTLLGTSKLITNSNTLILPNDCSINSVIRTSGYVLGNLKLTFPAGAPTCIYHVGDNTGYSPITVTLAGSAGGTLVGRVDQPDHPDTLTSASGIDWTKSANHYWTLTPGTLASSTSYSATLQFCANSGSCSALEVDTAANTGNFLVALKSSGIWSTQTVGAKTAYTTQVTGLTGFGEFSVGEISNNNCYNDGFTGADGAAPGANWSVGNKNTSATTFGNPKINNNRLRLTDTSNGVATWVTLQKLFPAAGNKVTLEFDHFAYGGGGADGIAVVLSNAATTSQAGAFGGSLGYAQKGESPISDCTTAGGCPGFGGGWLGVGIDEYGNFSATTDGRFGGTGFTQDSVSVRGSGSGMSGYRFLLGTGTLSPGVDGNNAASPPHRYRVIVDHTDSVHAWTSVERDISGGGTAYTALIGCPPGVTTGCTPFDVKDPGYSQDAVPAYWNVSFTGSTGATSNIHEVDTLKICTVQGLASLTFHHLKIEHGGTACTTNAATVTIKACATADCNALYMGSVTVNLSATAGTWAPASPITFSGGQTTVTLADSSAQTDDLGAVATSPTTSNATQCNGTVGPCSLTFAVCTFDAVEEGAAAYTPIYTKLANTSFNLDVLSLVDSPQTLTAIELVDMSSGTCSHPSNVLSPVTLSPALSGIVPNFTANQRKSFTFTYNNAAPNVRVRVTTAGSVYSCSSDNFAIRPQSFILTSEASNTGISGLPVISAGSPFWLDATAVSSTTTTGYTGTPKLNLSSGMVSTIPDTNPGNLGSAAFSAVGGGVARASGLTYSEVGGFSLGQYTVYDDTFAEVDSVKRECTSGFSNTLSSRRYSCQFGSSGNTFGRFVPHHFTITAGAPTSGCGSFTYFGQDGFTTSFTLTAQNANGGTTQNYTGDGVTGWAKLPLTADAAGYSRFGFAVSTWSPSQPPDAILAASSTAPTVTPTSLKLAPINTWEFGSIYVTAKHRISRPSALTGETGVTISAQPVDSDGVTTPAAVALNTALLPLRYGRLALQNAYGSELLDLAIPVSAQYWNGSSFVTNGLDNCTTLESVNIGYGNYQGTLSDTNIGGLSFRTADPITGSCTASSALSGSMSAGRSCILFSKPLSAATGSVDLSINLGSAGGSCLSPILSAGSSADMDYLSGNWCDQSYDRDPIARATFGLYKGNSHFIYIRELY